ncbi:MAG TPA: sulfide/dihydroorotate dehydrogenase-like FAD/NAD-binding protein, partial [Candidatus Hydrogenedentes bacterium]|nr:sulfide/dihydroorotate dehydrogenase-like FAD/NAD-binding protein [Candidatus Hydrogenedentota bacterium]
VREGMRVRTATPELLKLRRNVLALMMIEHPSACLVCGKRELCDKFRPKSEKAGRTTGCHTCNNKDVCEVRALSEDLGLTEIPVAPLYHMRPINRSNPFIDRDLNLCILCGRCVRICEHQQGKPVIAFINRSGKTHIGEAFGRNLEEAGCTFCGSCVDVCPTGTLADRYAKWYGRPEAGIESTCIFCDAACALRLGTKDNRLVAARAVNMGVPVCMLGRFALPEFLNGEDRLKTPHVRVGDTLREVPWDDAIASVAERLRPYVNDGFALVCDTTTPIEDRHLLKRFTNEVMKSDRYVEITPDARGVSRARLPEGTRALVTTGNFVDAGELDGLDAIIVLDCYPTAVSERAHAVLPAAVFAETEGTVLDGPGTPRPLRRACASPGQARPEWWTIAHLAQALGGEGFAYESAREITAQLGLKNSALLVERDEAPAPALNKRLARAFFRGHRIEEKVAGLRAMQGAEGRPADAVAIHTEGRFLVVEKREIVPNAHEIVIEAPEIAKKALPGQFIIVMVDERSERVPYTLCDWDAEKGTITLVVQEMGRSSRKLILTEAGDRLAHVVGPLGIPFEIKEYGTVALTGGCYGIGAILPIAKGLKAAGNRVVVVSEARSNYLNYYEEKLAGTADEFVFTTIDGSSGLKGHAVDEVGRRLRNGERLDCVVAVGCPFMMMLTSEETRPFGVKTFAALNPIMVDGTGMCGACRLTVDGKMKFACVDGPFFDAHQVDWDEVRDRREAYSFEEIRSVGRTEPVTMLHDGAHRGCGCDAHAKAGVK